MGVTVEIDDKDTSGDFDPLEAGWYDAAAIDFEERTSAAGNKYLSATFEIIRGPHTKRRVWANYNLWNRNPHARRFAHDDFRCFSLAVDQPYKGTVDTDGLLLKPVRLKLGLREWNQKIYNTVVDYRESDADVPEVGDRTPPYQPQVKEQSKSHQVKIDPEDDSGYDNIPF